MVSLMLNSLAACGSRHMFYNTSSQSDCSRISVELAQVQLFSCFFPPLALISSRCVRACVFACACLCAVCVWTVWYISLCIRVIFNGLKPWLRLSHHCTEPMCMYLCVICLCVGGGCSSEISLGSAVVLLKPEQSDVSLPSYRPQHNLFPQKFVGTDISLTTRVLVCAILCVFVV